MNNTSLKEWLNLSDYTKRNIFEETAKNIGFNYSTAIEKDWWVVRTIELIFKSSISESTVFKGGTSLSKAWGLIDRFSEDIDVTYSIDTLKKHYGEFENPWDYFNEEASWSNKKLEKELSNLKNIGQKYTDEVLLSMVQNELQKITDLKFDVISKDEMTLYIHYPQLLEQSEYGGSYVKPVVKIEAGVRSARVPTIKKQIDSFFEQVLEKSEPIEVEILRPDRTFWEKATILHAENSRNEPTRIEKRNHMSRHIYDLVKLYYSEYGQMAINNLELLADVVRHKSTFYKDNKADYENATPSNIKIVPTTELNDSFKTDYADMAKSMIVGNSLSYEELIKILSIIEIKFKRVV